MRITGRLRDGSFFTNPTLAEAFDHAGKTGGNVHIMGLCSDGRVHSDLEHLYGLLEMSRLREFPGHRVFVHAFTDGRDTLPRGGVDFIQAIENKCREFDVNPIATVIGRYYAMDRDNRWDRVEKAYRMLVDGEGKRFSSAVEALRDYYAHPSEPNRSGDEFVVPSVVTPPEGSVTRLRDGDSVIFFNFRGDMPREMCKAFVYEECPFEVVDKAGTRQRMGFERGPKLDLHFVTMTAYEAGLPLNVAFHKPEAIKNTLGSYLSEKGLRQFRCAETEKYPHVTFFFNDYRDTPFPCEEHRLVPSPRDVSTYDRKPEMSAYELTDVMLERIETGRTIL